jgi:hypothetical protein
MPISLLLHESYGLAETASYDDLGQNLSPEVSDLAENFSSFPQIAPPFDLCVASLVFRNARRRNKL